MTTKQPEATEDVGRGARFECELCALGADCAEHDYDPDALRTPPTQPTDSQAGGVDASDAVRGILAEHIALHTTKDAMINELIVQQIAEWHAQAIADAVRNALTQLRGEVVPMWGNSVTATKVIALIDKALTDD